MTRARIAPGPCSCVRSPRRLPARFAVLTPTAAAAGARKAAASRLLWLRLVDSEAAPLELLLVELFACGAPLGAVRHFDKPEPPRLAGGVIADQANRGDLADRREELFELLLI